MNAINQRELGVYNKFVVTRTDGKDAPGGKHEGDKYFVLNLTTDKNAIPALAAYADACASEYPKLADDLRGIVAGKVLEMSEYIIAPEITLPSSLVVPSFRVGKYLSSRGPMGTPVSIPTAKPWVNINYHDAIDACECNALDLITETQWLAIALDISQQDINWTGGKVGHGSIYQGLHLGKVNEAQDATFEPEESERRWHQLSNGERIYDFAGNANSWVFDDVQGNDKGLTGKIAADSISLTTSPHKSCEKGVGYIPDGARDWSGDALIRGGYWFSGSDAGVFSLGDDWPEYECDYVGFRCTKGL
jgi:formylglycine-generating enzyme required for sulfatase activity